MLNKIFEYFKNEILPYITNMNYLIILLGISGTISMIFGGISYFIITEIQDFSLSIIIAGSILNLTALLLSPRSTASFIKGRRGKYGTNSAIMFVCVLTIIILGNSFFVINSYRFDTTATRVFSLSKQTEKLLANLETPVRANAFFVPTDNDQAKLKTNAEDLLSEFAKKSSKFSYRFTDPQLNKTLAIKYGVMQYPAIVFEDLSSGKQQPVYEKAFNPFSEQDFITAMLIAMGDKQKVIYYSNGHKEKSLSRDISTNEVTDEGIDYFIEGLKRDNYDVKSINFEQVESVPSDAAALIIIGPKSALPQNHAKMIADYIAVGGRIAFLLDPNPHVTWNELLSNWGIIVSQQPIADPLSSLAGSKFLTPLLQKSNNQFVPEQKLLQYTRNNSAETKRILSITDQINAAFFPGAGAIIETINENERPFHVQNIQLGVSTAISWLEPDIEEPQFDENTDIQGPFSMISIIESTGPVTTNAPIFDLSKIMIFGDSDFVTNKWFYSNQNSDLILNSMAWLAEDYEVISIRPKVVPFRSIVVNRREREVLKWTSGLPFVLMLVTSTVVWWRRR
tara:strand:- start:9548 stop:11245 length:1698 start_codon:yes stop_codon:yes gene_type:complete